MTYIIAVWVPPHRERSVVPTRNFTPRLSSLSTYLSRTIGGSGTCTKYASVVCTNIWIFMKDASTISRRYSTIAVDRCQWPTRVVPMRSIAITIQACGKRCVGRVPLRLSFPHTLLFFLFQLRTMLFHLHSLFTSRALHAYATVSICSTEFLFLPSLLFTRFLRFTVCPLCFFLSSRTPPSLFSQLSFDHAESRSPFPLPIFLKIFHLIRSQANQLCSKEIIGFFRDFRDQMFLSLNKCREKILYLH